MDTALNNALNQPDINRVLLLAVEHADSTMRKYIWRGHRPKWSNDKELMVGDKTAKDFVNEALKRLCEGTRKYNQEKSLLENLNSITDSLIWSEKKSSDRAGIVEIGEIPDDAESPQDPISKAASPDKCIVEKLVDGEISVNHEKCFRMIRASFDGDPETQEYLDALSSGYYDISEISQLTDLPVAKIYEIRRKLKNYAPKFYGVPSYTELERKIREGC